MLMIKQKVLLVIHFVLIQESILNLNSNNIQRECAILVQSVEIRLPSLLDHEVNQASYVSSSNV